MFATGSIAASLIAYYKNQPFEYDPTNLSFAAITVYSYVFILPFALYCLLRFVLDVKNVTLLELVCVYGYAITLLLPISIICIFPIELLRWLAISIAFVISGIFMLDFLICRLFSNEESLEVLRGLWFQKDYFNFCCCSSSCRSIYFI